MVLYIHGYSPKGEKRRGVFGEDSYDSVIDKMMEFTGFASTRNFRYKKSKNIIAIATYYGNQPPSYYTPNDISDLENIDRGIPRYSLIMAKYAKEMMRQTDADNLAIVSASMGSLIARYIIEKDLEHLASDKVIKKWISLEGVIAGNIGASNRNLLNIVNTFKQQPYEVKQMKYSWIKEQFGSLYSSNSPYMRDIDISFESSTNDNLNDNLISYLTHEANDGVQAVKDTYFINYPHTFFYKTHTALDDSLAAWTYVSTFLTSNKRVKITLLSANLNDLHEDRLFYGSILPAEVVFESKVYAPKAMQRWHFSDPIDERVLKSYYLDIHKFYKEGEDKELDQIVFDGKVLENEEELELKITPYEIDRMFMYGIKEITGHGRYESLGSATIKLPLENGIYHIQSNEWSGDIQVEVF